MEGQILLWIQEHLRQDWLTPVMKGITTLGNAGIFWILLAVALVVFRRTRTSGWKLALALILMLVVNNIILKNLINRTRPYEVVEGLVSLLGAIGESSFPSGHTAVSFAAATILFHEFSWKCWLPGTILAALIAFSRLYLGVHYPTDILGGIVSGILCGVLSIVIFQCLDNYLERRK